MQRRHSREKRRGKVREDGRMERSPRRLFRSQGLHLPEGEDAGVGTYFLECVRPAEDWPEPINNLPNRISHEVSSCPFPKRSVVRMNHNDSSTTLRRIIRAKRNCKGPGRKIPKIFSSRVLRPKTAVFSLLSRIGESPLEQAPTGLRQDRLVAVPLHLSRLVARCGRLHRWISSTPMATMPERSRWARPHSTACFADLFLDETPVPLDVFESALELHPAGCGTPPDAECCRHDAAAYSMPMPPANQRDRCQRLSRPPTDADSALLEPVS